MTATDRLPAHQDADLLVYLDDARDVLGALPAATLDCSITLPLYWGLATTTWSRSFRAATQTAVTAVTSGIVVTIATMGPLASVLRHLAGQVGLRADTERSRRQRGPRPLRRLCHDTGSSCGMGNLGVKPATRERP
jgi:hypothetical protein